MANNTSKAECTSCKKTFLTMAMFYGDVCFGCQMKRDEDSRIRGVNDLKQKLQ